MCQANTEENSKANKHYFESLEINPSNIRSRINYSHFCLDPTHKFFSIEKAESILSEGLLIHESSSILVFYLKSLLSEIYFREYYFNKTNRIIIDKIKRLGFSVGDSNSSHVRNCIYLVNGIDDNRSAWYYILVKPNKLRKFIVALNDEIIHLLEYGDILHSAYGETAPESITNRLKIEYKIDENIKFSKPLKKFLTQSYSSTVVARQNATRLDHSLNQVSNQVLYIPFGRIKFEEKIGSGAYGDVFKGTWLYQSVAVKRYRGTELPQSFLEEARKELDVMSRLQHQSLIRLFGYSTELNSPPMIVMEYGSNGSLYKFLHDGKSISWSVRIRLALELSRGLAYLHANNIVHRDIKSLNVILDEDLHAKWCDFGLSKIRINSTTTSVTYSHGDPSLVGTILWMAPELFQRTTAGFKSDIWAIGMVFYELASRQLPFQDAISNEQVIEWIKSGSGENVPEECQNKYPKFGLIMKDCWKSRDLRPQAAEIVVSLENMKY